MSGIKWIGHSSVVITAGNGTVIYIDPWDLGPGAAPADIILVNHPHYDHFSPADIRKISQSGTSVIGPAECAEKLGGRILPIKPGAAMEIKGVKIEAYPAYNIDKPFHKKESGWMGYLIEADSERIYISGYTDFIPEIRDIKCDTALLAVGGKYTMDVDEAVMAAAALNPGRAIPIHYGKITGTAGSGRQFKNKYSGRTLLLDPED